MPKAKLRFVGLDVHKDSIAIAVAEDGRRPARDVGTFSSDWLAIEKQLKRLAKGVRLHICYEAGPTGFELHRRLTTANVSAPAISARSSLPP